MIMGLRGLAGNEGKIIPPSKTGKLKASLQFWAIGFVMIDLPIEIINVNLDTVVVCDSFNIFLYIWIPICCILFSIKE